VAIGLIGCALVLWSFSKVPILEIIERRIGSAPSNNERLEMARIAVQAFAEYPLTGIGSLNFPAYLIENANRRVIIAAEPEKLEPHNVFLQIAAEEGIFAFVSFLSMIFILVSIIVTTMRGTQNEIGVWRYVYGIKLFMIVMMSNLLFGFIADKYRFFFIVLVGLTLSFLRLPEWQLQIGNLKGIRAQ
jgi:O-antigen ligase